MRVLAQNGAWCKDSKALRYRDCAGIDRIVHGGRMVRYHDCAGIGRCMHGVWCRVGYRARNIVGSQSVCCVPILREMAAVE